MSTDLHIVVADQLDPRLGRHVVHDPRSRGFAFAAAPAPALPTKALRHRIYAPRPIPTQLIGCCTGVDQCVKADAQGNRIAGKILTLDDAVRLYTRATQLDDLDGQYDPATGEGDTGSTGLAACKASKEAGIITRYEWLFAGPQQILAALYGDPRQPGKGKPVGVGTWWYEDMFNPDRRTLLVEPTGKKAGGHQWSVIGYSPALDAFEGMCWWGPDFGDSGMFRIRRTHLADLLADDGDAHVTYRTQG